MVMTREQQALNLGLAGVSCSIAQTAVQPCETAMVRQQLVAYGGHKLSFLNTLRSIAANEGLRGLYRGIEAGLLREMSYSTLRFGLYEPLRDAMNDNAAANAAAFGEDMAGAVRVAKRAFAGCAAGGIASAIASPTDLLKVRAQSDMTLPIPGLGHFVRKVAAQPSGPVRPFYEGVSATISRAVVLGATKMVTYNEVKDLLKRSPAHAEPSRQPAAWQLAVGPLSYGWREAHDWRAFGHDAPPSTEGRLGLVFATSVAAGLAITITTSPITNARTHMMAKPGGRARLFFGKGHGPLGPGGDGVGGMLALTFPYRAHARQAPSRGCPRRWHMWGRNTALGATFVASRRSGRGEPKSRRGSGLSACATCARPFAQALAVLRLTLPFPHCRPPGFSLRH